jgi:hypothetical protein
MTATSFGAQIEEWAKKVEGATEAVFREASESVISEMQTPGPSKATAKKAIAGAVGLPGKGKKTNRMGPIPNPGGPGRLPVDTGFLRASLLASTNAMPTLREDAKPEEGKTYSFTDDQIALVISGAELGQTIYAGYTAAYARRVHYEGSQWVVLAAQNWGQHVDRATQKVKTELGL